MRESADLSASELRFLLCLKKFILGTRLLGVKRDGRMRKGYFKSRNPGA